MNFDLAPLHYLELALLAIESIVKIKSFYHQTKDCPPLFTS